MQQAKFESLISPPWPETEDYITEFETMHARRQLEDLSNFERNEKSEENLDHIVMLGYN